MSDLKSAIERYKNPELYRKSDPISGEYWDEELQEADLIALADGYFDACAASSKLGTEIARLTEEIAGMNRIKESHSKMIQGVWQDHERQIAAVAKERDEWKEKYLQAMEQHGFTREFVDSPHITAQSQPARTVAEGESR